MLIFTVCWLLSLTLTAAAKQSDGVQNDFTKDPWTWECIDGICVKLLKEETGNQSLCLGVCKLFCNEYGSMWPKPTGYFYLGNKLAFLNINSIDFITAEANGDAEKLLRSAKNRFLEHIQMILPKKSEIKRGGKSMVVSINIEDITQVALTLQTNEGYTLLVMPSVDGRINATINAQTYFGARNGLESLEQFILYDDFKGQLLVAEDLYIVDEPIYPLRGILLDTARNYFPISAIKRTLDAMSFCKLNTFHWHITDSQSFPFVSKSQPNLSRLGAFSPEKVYTSSEITGIVQYALERGIRVIPEFDSPSHVGEGWQGTNLTVCFKAQPWGHYCMEPPCGQLDPTEEKLYDVLQDIYTDMFGAFKPDIFHMGGDEVVIACWNSSAKIQDWMLKRNWDLDAEGFFRLWDYFQSRAREKVYKANGGEKLPLVLWTSGLTNFRHIDMYLNSEDYIIQVWTTVKNKQIMGLLKKGYRLILSNYDALYLDCGFGAWLGAENNWCSPYIGWKKIYQNSPAKIAGEFSNLIIGSEAAMWSEQVDSLSLDNRLWPRAGALAERLWAEPETGWQMAEKRMFHFRERLVNMGISANNLQPEWCYNNEGHCYKT